MGSTERSIFERIQSDIEAIDGTGSNNFDLSTSGQVRIGIASEYTPGVSIFSAGNSTAQVGGVTRLNAYTRQIPITIEAVSTVTSDDPGEALLSAWDIGADIRRVLENDRSLGGITGIDDVEVEMVAVLHEQESTFAGLALLQVLVKYTETAGA